LVERASVRHIRDGLHSARRRRGRAPTTWGSHSDTLLVTINNVAATANSGADQTVNEGTLLSLDGSFSVPGTADTHTFLWQVAASNGQVIAKGTGEDFGFTPKP
jgi:hypothetical protein